MAEHRGFGFDPADAPGEDTQTVGHRRMRIGADDGIGIRDVARARDARRPGTAGTEHDAPEKFDIDLMHDARIGWHRAEIRKRALAPLEKGVALAIAIELELGVFFKGRGGAEAIDLHRVIDDEFDRLQRIDGLGIAAHFGHRIAHRGEIDDARHAGKVLK